MCWWTAVITYVKTAGLHADLLFPSVILSWTTWRILNEDVERIYGNGCVIMQQVVERNP